MRKNLLSPELQAGHTSIATHMYGYSRTSDKGHSE